MDVLPRSLSSLLRSVQFLCSHFYVVFVAYAKILAVNVAEFIGMFKHIMTYRRNAFVAVLNTVLWGRHLHAVVNKNGKMQMCKIRAETRFPKDIVPRRCVSFCSNGLTEIEFSLWKKKTSLNRAD